MSNKALRISLSTLFVPLTLTLGCGDGPQETGENGEINEHIDLSSIEITSHGELYLTHPVQVAVEAELHGEAFETDLVIGMRALGDDEGCVLGAMPVTHDGGEAVYAQEAEFVISRTCYELVGRDDVELFAAFDPWNRVDDVDIDPIAAQLEEAKTPGDVSIYAIIAAAALDVEGCESCETTHTVHASPGLDAQLHELSTSSTVAVLPVGSDEGVEPANTTERIDFFVSSQARVTGLDSGEGLPDGQVRMRHTIRPLGSTGEGMPLTERKGDYVGEAYELSVPSYGSLNSISALSLEGPTRERIAGGSWSGIDEFELVTCLETEFDQAIYAGEDAPQANDCGALPVVVVREPVGEDGRPLPQPGAANSREADVWGGTWEVPADYNFGDSSVTFETWLDINSSDTPSTTYKGIEVHSPGSWFEAGVYAGGQVFGPENTIDLVDIYATFIAYDFGGGGVAMGATIFFWDFIEPFEIQMYNGVPLSLQEIFHEANIGIPTTWTSPGYSLVGASFNDGCGQIAAGIWVDGTIGIDADLTTVTARTTTRGVEVEAVINPFATLQAHAGIMATYSEYLGGGITANLDVVRVDIPFTASVESIDYDPLDATRLEFSESAIGEVSTLQGSIDFEIYAELGACPICIVFEHDHTIANWNGINLFSFPIFAASQSINFGSDINSSTFCTSPGQTLHSGDFDGDAVMDYVCWKASSGKRWYDWGDDGHNGSEWTRDDGWCSGSDDELLIGDFNGDGRDDLLCQSSGTKEIDFANQYGKHGSVDRSFSFAWCDGSVASTPTQMIRTGDYNDDGIDDLYCYNYSIAKHYLNYVDSNGNFDNSADWTGYTSNNAKIQAAWDSSMCLNVEGNDSSTNGANVNLYNCNNGAEAWHLYYPLDGKIRASWDTNMCLDVAGTNTSTNGANVQIYDCDSVTETWYLDSSDNKIHAQWDPDMCLNIVGQNTSAGYSNANLYACSNVTETWTVVEQ